MMKPVSAGLVVGAISSALSWNGHRFLDPHQVSTFPDLVTALSIPVLVGSAVWLIARTGRGADDVRVGRAVAISAAFVFAASAALLVAVRFSRWHVEAGLAAAGLSALGALGLGAVGAGVGKRLARSDSARRAGHA